MKKNQLPGNSRQAAAAAAALLLLLAAIPALAHTADIAELGLSVSLPQTLDVFTRDMTASDPLPGLYGTTAGAVRDSLASRGLWLEARDIAGKYVLTLEARDDGGADYRDMGDGELQVVLPGAEIVRTRQAAFALYEHSGVLVGVTRAGGRLFTLRLTPSGRITDAKWSALRDVVRGMDFSFGQ